MDTQQIISDLIVLAFPFLVALAYNFYKQYESKLPTNVQKFINTNAPIVVQQVEQQFSGSDGTAKKKQALTALQALLQHAGLPLPDQTILNTAIEAAVYLLNQDQKVLAPPQKL